MSSQDYRNMLRWLVGILVGLLAVGLALVSVSGDIFGPIIGPGTLIGWAIPLCTVFVVVAVCWFLLSSAAGSTGDSDPSYVDCPVCGAANLPDWRMCPYCGSRTVPRDEVEQTDEMA